MESSSLRGFHTISLKEDKQTKPMERRTTKNKKNKIKRCTLCTSEEIKVTLVHDAGHPHRGEILKACPHLPPLYLPFLPEELTINELKSVLADLGLPKTARVKAELVERLRRRYEIEISTPPPSTNPPPSLPRETPSPPKAKTRSGPKCKPAVASEAVEEESREEGEKLLFRAGVRHLRDLCDTTDRYLLCEWQLHKTPQVDHILEIQLCEHAWESLSSSVRRTRGQEADLRRLINSCNNLNVTSRAVNLAKGGRGGAFERAVVDLSNQVYRPDQTIFDYMSNSRCQTRLQASVQRNIADTIVTTWEMMEKDLRQRQALAIQDFANQMHEILFDVLKIEDGP
eukprot:gene7110-7862_t